jgi:tetratricopeptide (TPR) repeat protein
VTLRARLLSPLAASMIGALVIGTLTLGACGGDNPADPGPPRDIKLDQANNAGSQALSMDLPDVAVRQYKVALARAYERDDAGAIGDVAYNLALAQLKAGDAKGAVASVRAAQAELERRRMPVPAELSLVQAAASYRARDPAGAVAAAQQALDRPAGDPDTVPRAWFIRGLVAADQGDRAALAQAIAALRPSKSADLEADRQELQGRAALLDNQPADAITAFDQAATNRQQSLDYRGMARTLALAGETCVRLERNADAAAYFLRAGRSALLQGDTATASPFLKRAEELATRSGQTAIVDEVARLRRETAPKASTR